ncbi:hypothetical protein Clacol_006549 [Clathrus columnatus]|uniref:tRNA(Ile)-lysidine synthetase n=1 Tax=Clathrus columnatus TaxID=1419009 RepID=A0AAV5AGQ5_9AGAM|nr:hypothetical protein Clacol_006549 [Clathrus columnatus]
MFLTIVTGVAHSGGPDSTCLLYLLNAWLKTQSVPSISLLSLTVDHQLQSSSTLITQQAANFARSLGVQNCILTIPWSIPPYPKRPENDEAFEAIARQARYDILQSEMKTYGSFLLAMAHHADDNVETLLMRINDQIGYSNKADLKSVLNPIRPRRRIGMSNANKLLGLRQWILRPLLSVPKTRILATCEHYKIPYTIDQTNFQPSITPRNFIRYCLQTRLDTQQHSTITPPTNSRLTVDLVNESISTLESVAEKYVPSTYGSPLSSRLYSAAKYVSDCRETLDEKVTSYLSQLTLPSPISTLTLPSNVPPIQDALVPPYIIRRILRYISPAPWGHPSAEAFGSSTNLEKISSLIWANSVPDAERRPFTLGSQVIWRPHTRKSFQGKKILCWIASRQPPILRNGSIEPCLVEITHIFKSSQDEEFQIVWDNRFLVIIRPTLMPSHVKKLLLTHTNARIVIAPYSKWFSPRLEFRYPSDNKECLIVLGECPNYLATPFSLQKEASPLGWISFEFIRPIDSI